MFYAVYKGRHRGVFQTWEDCLAQVTNFKGGVFRKFESYDDALTFSMNGKLSVERQEEIRTLKSIKQESKSSSSGTKSKSNLEPLEKEIAMYTDGASSHNGHKNVVAGYGVYVPNEETLNISKRLPLGPNGEMPSNQRAELMAIKEAIELSNYHYSDDSGLLILTDSMYSIQCVSNVNGNNAWARKWSRNGWMNGSNEPVKNRDIIEPLYKMINERLVDTKRGSVRFIHVRGHCGIIGNEKADKLAVAGKKISLP